MSVHLAKALGEVTMPSVIQKLTIMKKGNDLYLQEVNSQRYYHGDQPNTWAWKNAIFLLIIFCANFEDND